MKKFASVLVLALMAVLMLSAFAPALAEEAAAAATDSAIPAKAIAAAKTSELEVRPLQDYYS